MKREAYRRNEEILKFFIVLIVFLVVIFVVYYFFLYTKTCQDRECFSSYLLKCKKASWINDAPEASWLYTIKGESKKNCEVEVKLQTVKEGKLDMGKAEGKSMLCYIPTGVVASPEKDLEKCTGLLKEELQGLIIKRMHSYILENLGEISEEMTKAL